MDDFTKLLVESILARHALNERNHRGWCAGFEPGCDEAEKLSIADAYAYDLALEAIVKRGADVEVREVKTS